MKSVKRDLYYVAPEVKPSIVKRIVTYWVLCLAFATLPLVIGRTMAQPDVFFMNHFADVAQLYWPMYVMFLGILPFAVRDAMRLTNRTLGPLQRLKFELSEFRKTGSYHPVNARETDFLHDLINEIDVTMMGQVEPANEVEVPQEELVESAV